MVHASFTNCTPAITERERAGAPGKTQPSSQPVPHAARSPSVKLSPVFCCCAAWSAGWRARSWQGTALPSSSWKTKRRSSLCGRMRQHQPVEWSRSPHRCWHQEYPHRRCSVWNAPGFSEQIVRVSLPIPPFRLPRLWLRVRMRLQLPCLLPFCSS